MPKVTPKTKPTAKKKKAPVLTPEELSRKSTEPTKANDVNKVEQLFGAFVKSELKSERLAQRRQRIHIAREIVSIITYTVAVGLLAFIGYVQYEQTQIVKEMGTYKRLCVDERSKI